MRIIIRKHWWWAPVGAVVLFFGLNILRTARSPSPALARASDAEAARRTEEATAGLDRRWPRKATDGLVVGNGVVEPRGEVIRVAGAVPGRIAAILVREGDRVAAGQVLARLDDEVEHADIASAVAEQEIAVAELARVRRGNRTEDRRVARAVAARAMTQASHSRSAYERLRKVHRAAEGAVALEQLDQARSRFEADEQSLRQAMAERDRVLKGARSEDRRVAKARLQTAEARLERARVRLAQRKIVAPADGEVLLVNHRAGEYYLPGDGRPLVELGDTRRLLVRMEIDERDLGRVAVGAAAFVEAVAYPTRRFPARVSRLGRRMGRKQIITTDPAERRDVQVLELLLELEPAAPLVVGQRVIAYVSSDSGSG